MTRETAIEKACIITDRAWRMMDPDSRFASDCFCRERDIHYQNDGKAFRFLEFLLARVTPAMIDEFEKEERHAV